MIYKLKDMVEGESGITKLETAIVLVAYIVVVAVFVFTILLPGT